MSTQKKSIKVFVIAGLMLVFFGFVQSVRADAEVINSFDARITIQNDGVLAVTETIVYDFGSNQKHGIFRDIPLIASNGPSLGIKVLSVKNEAGQAYHYSSSVKEDSLEIKIGDPNVLIHGIKTYVVSYQVYGAIRTFSDHDELYWNVTGNQWPVSINQSVVTVKVVTQKLPDFQTDCFTGPRSSTEKSCTVQISGVIENMNPSVMYRSNRSFLAGEGLTVVLGMPLGIINPSLFIPADVYKVGNPSGSWSKILPTVFGIGFAVLWASLFIFGVRKGGRFTKPGVKMPKELRGQPVVVQYTPPDELTPVDIGYLMDRKLDPADITATILDLAVRGYLKIRYIFEERTMLPDKKDYEFVKLKDGSDLTHPAYLDIFQLLFIDKDTVTLSELKSYKNRIWVAGGITLLREKTKKFLTKESYLESVENWGKRTSTFPGVIVLALIGLTISSIFFMIFSMLSPKYLFGLITFSIIAIVAITRLFPFSGLTSDKGLKAFAGILGFKEFLELTEKDKLDLLNAPALQPELFEKFLPYAVALGIEQKWAEKFADITMAMPAWFEGQSGAFNAIIFTQAISSFNTSISSAVGVSTGGYSSGLGGGGSSGGGSGGGGGGSW